MKTLHILLTGALLLGIPSTLLAAIPPEGAVRATGSVEESTELKVSPISVKRDLVVNVGAGLVSKPFILDGTKSQDDGTVGFFLWRQVSGPLVELSNASALSLSVTPLVAGTYVFELVATDSAGLSSVVQRNEVTVGKEAPQARTTPPTGDPDFDLLKVKSSSGTSGSAEPVRSTKGFDASAGKGSITGDPDFDLLRAKSNDDRDDEKATKEDVDFYSESDDESASIGDPDFDLLNIEISEDDLSQLRAEVSDTGEAKKVNVRGWDPEKKEEIIARPEDVETPKDLKVYLEAVALRDEAIERIAIKDERVVITSEEEGKLFGFIPVSISGQIVIDYKFEDSTEDQVKVKFPWWHVFVKKTISLDALETELSSGLDDFSWQKVDNSETSTEAGRISRAVGRVSNVLKTRHDTAKNSVSNIR